MILTKTMWSANGMNLSQLSMRTYDVRVVLVR